MQYLMLPEFRNVPKLYQTSLAVTAMDRIRDSIPI